MRKAKRLEQEVEARVDALIEAEVADHLRAYLSHVELHTEQRRVIVIDRPTPMRVQMGVLTRA